MNTKDYYTILGVTASAEDVVIRAAYKALAQKYHPDKANNKPADSHSTMQEINEAYAILGNSAKRTQYDQFRSEDFQETKQPPPNHQYSSKPRTSSWTTPLNRIDDWTTEKVEGLQQQVASELGKTVEFQDPPFTIEVSGGFFNFSSGMKVIHCPKMVVIPPGKLMNSLKIQHPFALGCYAVTNAEFMSFCSVTGREKPKDSGKKNNPVQDITWFDAIDYCSWLSSVTGKDYRLPTQEEWEFACRAGTTTKYYFGDTITPKQANFGGMYHLVAKGIFPEEPNRKPKYSIRSYSDGVTSVKRYSPNPWGLFQMYGNVSEWVLNKFPDNKRIACGGSAYSYEEGLGSDSVLEVGVGGDLSAGFRVARSI